MIMSELERKLEESLRQSEITAQQKHVTQHPPPATPAVVVEATPHLQTLKSTVNKVFEQCNHTIQMVKENSADITVLTDVTAILTVLSSALANLHSQLTQEYEQQCLLREKEKQVLDQLNQYLETWL